MHRLYITYCTLCTVLRVVMSMLMVFDRHRVAKSLHNFLECLWYLTYDICGIFYIVLIWVSSHHFFFQYFTLFNMDNKSTYSISLHFIPIQQWSHSNAHFGISCKQLKETCDGNFLYVYYHVNRTLLHESQRGGSAMSHQCKISPT